MHVFIEILIAVLVIAAALCFAATVIELYRAPDALTRLNLTGPIVGVAIPLLIIANLLNTWLNGWEVGPPLIKSIVAITGYLVVVSIASFTLGRSLHADQLRERQPDDFDAEIPPEVQKKASEGKPSERGWERADEYQTADTSSREVADVKPVVKDVEAD